MPYFSNEKRTHKNTNGFELQEPRGTVGKFLKIVSGVGGLGNSFHSRIWTLQVVHETEESDSAVSCILRSNFLSWKWIGGVIETKKSDSVCHTYCIKEFFL